MSEREPEACFDAANPRKSYNALKDRPPGEVVNGAFEAMEHPDTAARYWAVRYVGLTGDVSAAPRVVAILADPQASVASQAAWALGQLGGAESVDPLVSALGHSAWVVRGRAAEAFMHRPDERAIPGLALLLADRQKHVRTAAALALAEIGTAEAAEALAAAAATHRGLRGRQARHGLAVLARKQSSTP